MAVNGIEIKIGQLWRTRGGASLRIIANNGAASYPWVVDDRTTRADNGRNGIFAAFEDGDLDMLLHDTVPAARTADTVPDATACITKEQRQQFVDDLLKKLSEWKPNLRAEKRDVDIAAIFRKIDKDLTAVEDADDAAAIDTDIPSPAAFNEDGWCGCFYTPDYLCAKHGQVPVDVGRPAGLGDSADPLGGIGDINSQARGSGARFNAGKPDFALLPLTLVAQDYDIETDDRNPGDEVDAAIMALYWLGQWQARDEYHDDYPVLQLAVLDLGLGGLAECARVLTYGAQKYNGWNWARGMLWSVPLACAARHLVAIIEGEAIDQESGLPHRGHVIANLYMLLTFESTFPEGDDRAPAGSLAPDDSDWADDGIESHNYGGTE